MEDSTPVATVAPNGTLVSLEHRLSERTFRRYEPLLAAAVESFPIETKFIVPPDLAPTTFLGRFRDSRVSLIRYNWPSTVDREKLLSIMGKHVLSLSADNKVVWFRQRGHAGRPVELATAPIVDKQTTVMRWGNASTQEIEAGCLLLSHKRISGTIVVSGRVDNEVVARLEDSLDVSLVHDPKNNETIIT